MLNDIGSRVSVTITWEMLKAIYSTLKTDIDRRIDPEKTAFEFNWLGPVVDRALDVLAGTGTNALSTATNVAHRLLVNTPDRMYRREVKDWLKEPTTRIRMTALLVRILCHQNFDDEKDLLTRAYQKSTGDDEHEADLSIRLIVKFIGDTIVGRLSDGERALMQRADTTHDAIQVVGASLVHLERRLSEQLKELPIALVRQIEVLDVSAARLAGPLNHQNLTANPDISLGQATDHSKKAVTSQAIVVSASSDMDKSSPPTYAFHVESEHRLEKAKDGKFLLHACWAISIDPEGKNLPSDKVWKFVGPWSDFTTPHSSEEASELQKNGFLLLEGSVSVSSVYCHFLPDRCREERHQDDSISRYMLAGYTYDSLGKNLPSANWSRLGECAEPDSLDENIKEGLLRHGHFVGEVPEVSIGFQDIKIFYVFQSRSAEKVHTKGDGSRVFTIRVGYSIDPLASNLPPDEKWTHCYTKTVGANDFYRPVMAADLHNKGFHVTEQTHVLPPQDRRMIYIFDREVDRSYRGQNLVIKSERAWTLDKCGENLPSRDRSAWEEVSSLEEALEDLKDEVAEDLRTKGVHIFERVQDRRIVAYIYMFAADDHTHERTDGTKGRRLVMLKGFSKDPRGANLPQDEKWRHPPAKLTVTDGVEYEHFNITDVLAGIDQKGYFIDWIDVPISR